MGCTTPLTTSPIPYTLDSGGIQLADRPLRVDFGRTEESTLVAMEKLEGRGPRDRGVCSDGTSFASWPNGVSLIFRDATFVRWVDDSTRVCAFA